MTVNNLKNNGNIAISVNDVSKHFNGLKALDKVSFSVKKGEIFGILGPDGAGKTTLMRILAGLMPYAAGSVNVLGYDLKNGSSGLCDHIAYMSQRFGLYEDLTVMENILFYADLYDMAAGPALDKRIDELLNFCRMTPFKNRKAGKLSGGMKQKLGLTCALIHTPELLLLDEPTNGVDPVSRRDFWKILHEMLKTGLTIFVSTTYLDEAERCNRVAFINRGVINTIDTPLNLKNKLSHKMWELEVSDKFAAVECLKKNSAVSAALMMGAVVHIFTDFNIDNKKFDRDILNDLKKSGIEFGNYKEVRPSLEDVFIEKMG